MTVYVVQEDWWDRSSATVLGVFASEVDAETCKRANEPARIVPCEFIEATTHRIYECGICGHCHAWDWNGDCREDGARFADAEDYAQRKGIDVNLVVTVDMAERVAADLGHAE